MNGKDTRQEDSRRVFYKGTQRESHGKRMEVLFVILAVLCLVYYVIVVICSGPGTSFSWFWILMGIGFLIFSLYWRICRTYPGRLPVWGKGLILSLLAAGFLVFALLLFQVLGGIHRTAPEDLPYVIVLGAKVKGDRPSRALRKRLETALSYAEQNPSATLILSGGQGPDEVCSEAASMREYLLQQGIPEEHILTEDQSTDTAENMRFSSQLLGEAAQNKKIAFFTTNYHVFRAGLKSRQAGMRAVGMGAPTKWYFWPNAAVREFVGLLTEHRGKQALLLSGIAVVYAVLTVLVYL